MPFEKGHKFGGSNKGGNKRKFQTPPFSIKDIWDQWAAIIAYLNSATVSHSDKMGVHKWLFPLICAYQFGKPTEKVEHSGDISININVVSK